MWDIGSGNPQLNDWQPWNFSVNKCQVMIPLAPAFRDFLKLLEEHDVPYLLVGGYAVAFHGFVRYTGDLDVFVEISDSTADKLVSVFKEFGFDLAEVRRDTFLTPGNIVRIGNEPVRIEVLNQIDGVLFSEAFDNRLEVEVDGVRLLFLSLDLLIVNKGATGRNKDKFDLLELKRIREERD
jgi:predicted nucleotidyltransferase